MSSPDCLFLFTGENTFALNEELQHWKKAFLKKHGEANWQHLSGKNLDWHAFMDEVCTAPFLGKKRLVVVDGIPTKITKEDIENLVAEMHPSTIVAFTESKPDKRKSVTKFLIKSATVRTFGNRTPQQLITWITGIASECNTEISPNVAAHLISVVGTDQWHLKQEIYKLISYAETSVLTEKDIDTVCLPSTKHTVWVMSDMIGKGKVEDAAKLAALLHASGEDAYSLWNIFLWIMKNISTLWIYTNEKDLSIGALSKEAGIPYHSVQSLLPCVRKFTKDKMCKAVEGVVKADLALKTGEIKATITEPVELMTMLERQILLLGR